MQPWLCLNALPECWIVCQERSINDSLAQECLQKIQLAISEWQDSRKHCSRLIQEVLGE